MNFERSISFLLFCLILGVAMAAKDGEQRTGKRVRTRRALINVQKQAAAEVNRLSNEFGALDDRELEEEDLRFLDDMSMSMSVAPKSKGKGKSKGGSKRRRY